MRIMSPSQEAFDFFIFFINVRLLLFCQNEQDENVIRDATFPTTLGFPLFFFSNFNQ